jgi:hypothetical protein
MFEITAALTAARSTYEVLKTGIDARDDIKVKAALADLQMKLFDATSAALAMAEKSAALQSSLGEVEREKAELQRRLDERAMYRLEELEPGFFAYGSQPAAGTEDVPKHYLCQACHGNDVKTVLRFIPASAYTAAEWRCVSNHAHRFLPRTR